MTEISRMAGSIYQPAPLTNWVSQGLKWSKKEAGSLPQSEIEFPHRGNFFIWKWWVLVHSEWYFMWFRATRE